MRHFALIVAMCLVTLTGCGTPPKNEPGVPFAMHSQFYEAECALGTQEAEQFHTLIHYPFEHSLRFPGMVIGIEKSSAELVKRGAIAASQNAVPKNKAEEWLFEKMFKDTKSMFISHVVHTGTSGKLVNPASYNVYHSVRRIDKAQAKPGNPVDCHGRPVADLDVFDESWTAIRKIRDKLADDLDKGSYTDLVVISMGWNTNQVEAVQNFNSLVHQLENAATAANQANQFRPYVIGVTWPSEWNSALVEPVVRFASVFNKGDDADEVGAGWLGAIVQHGILEVTQARKEKPLRVTVLGHSFGARATSMAVCLGSILIAPEKHGFKKDLPAPGAINWLIGLQGAYSLNRYLSKGAGLMDLRYQENCPTTQRMLLTASANDIAANFSSNVFPTAPFAGQRSTWEAMKDSENRSKFNFYLANAIGQALLLQASSDPGGSSWEYVEASNLIFYAAHGTGAGAHSDIYRPPMGTLMWRFINSSRR